MYIIPYLTVKELDSILNGSEPTPTTTTLLKNLLRHRTQITGMLILKLRKQKPESFLNKTKKKDLTLLWCTLFLVILHLQNQEMKEMFSRNYFHWLAMSQVLDLLQPSRVWRSILNVKHKPLIWLRMWILFDVKSLQHLGLQIFYSAHAHRKLSISHGHKFCSIFHWNHIQFSRFYQIL